MNPPTPDEKAKPSRRSSKTMPDRYGLLLTDGRWTRSILQAT